MRLKENSAAPFKTTLLVRKYFEALDSLEEETGPTASDIAGLSFLRQPLRYLGIFNVDAVSNFHSIPAERVAGDHGEDQILLSLEVFIDRPKMAQLVLNEAYQLYRFNTDLHRHSDALELVIEALNRHPQKSSLQVAGSAAMFYIIRERSFSPHSRRRVILTLLNGMELHLEETVLVRNCCLSLCQFEIPKEIMWVYRRTAVILTKVLDIQSSDALSQRIVIFLLNSMACHVEGPQKVVVGTIGAIEVILQQIQRRHATSICDDVLEVSWSFLWNITDETPSNCERFLNADGLKLFQACYAQFPNEVELVRNMMGLIGNIAEVDSLRRLLMKDTYLHIFVNLLDCLTDGIEISYNSAGVLAHLLSEGEEVWERNVRISRKLVNDEIIRATSLWELNSKRYINYRSFRPILRLLPMFHSPGSQHWGVWALCNLTTTDLNKYCRYVQDEGGEPLLLNIVGDARSSDKIKELANIVLTNIETWRRRKDLDESGEFEDMQLI